MSKARKKVGIALGGGAARGIAHVGILKGLIDAGIPIDYIAGVSSGCIAGSLVAAGVDIDDLLKTANKLNWSDFASLHISRKSMMSSKPISNLIKKFIGDMTIGELKIPFAALATDLLTGESHTLSAAELIVHDVVRASASFPGVYMPHKIGNQYFTDGGASTNIPSQIVRAMGADIVIAVDVIPSVKLTKLPRHVATIADRGLDLLLSSVSQFATQDADIVLRPVREHINSFHVKKAERLIEMGISEVNRQLPDIRGKIK